VGPPRGASEPRSHNRPCVSRARRFPSSCSSCPSWLLQLSPGGNALSGERQRPGGGDKKMPPPATTFTLSRLHPLVRPFHPAMC
jgi:hypothetical protein